MQGQTPRRIGPIPSTRSSSSARLPVTCSSPRSMGTPTSGAPSSYQAFECCAGDRLEDCCGPFREHHSCPAYHDYKR